MIPQNRKPDTIVVNQDPHTAVRETNRKKVSM